MASNDYLFNCNIKPFYYYLTKHGFKKMIEPLTSRRVDRTYFNKNYAQVLRSIKSDPWLIDFFSLLVDL